MNDKRDANRSFAVLELLRQTAVSQGNFNSEGGDGLEYTSENIRLVSLKT